MDPVNPRRRQLLKFGLGGAVLAAAGGGTLRWFGGGYALQLTADDKPLALTAKEFAVGKAFVESVFPAEAGFPAGTALGVHQRIDEELWSTTAGTRDDMKNGLQLFEHATLLHGFGSRFTALTPAQRLAYVNALLSGGPGPLQQVALALKEMAYLFYYTRPATWKTIGYDGPFMPVAKPPDSHAAYAAALAERSRA